MTDQMALPPTAKLLIDNVTVKFPTSTVPFHALCDVSLAVPQGSLVGLIGPSGCGKSTLLNVAAGLQAPDQGRVIIDGEDVTCVIGRTGYMMQKDLLLPWRTVLDNVVLGMELKGVPAKVSRARALPYLRRYGLDDFQDRHPNTLSGGMRQRTALLRTLLVDSGVILLDEPFGALDAQTRLRMQEWLLRIWGEFGKTVVFVTHDIDEAIFLSDEVVVMGARPGRIVARLPVPIARPRPRSAMASEAIATLKQQCLELLTIKADQHESCSNAA